MMSGFKALLTAFILSLLLCITASANNVSHIALDVVIDENADAHITQTWTGEFTEGTENYIVIGNLNGMEIKNFRVSEGSVNFTLENSWDIDASRGEKKNKCGILRYNDGKHELCWGIGEYGSHTYTVSYTLTDFVAGYLDRDGSNFMYVNPEMSTFPTSVAFTLSLSDGRQLTDDISDVWAFGFDGKVGFSNGRISAYTEAPLKGSRYFVIMFSLDKGILSPSRIYDCSFEEVRDKAFEGSDYSDGSEGMWPVYLILGVVAVGFLFAAVYLVTVFLERRKFIKSADYFRDAPNKSDICMNYYLALKFGIIKNEGNIIGALIMQMINSGNISCETEKSVGFFGKEKETHEIMLVSQPEDEYFKRLYEIMHSAAGEDGILQENELEKYCSKKYNRVRTCIDKLKDKGENSFCSLPGFTAGITHRIKGLSEQGRSALAELVGFKKYLEEFTLIDEREVKEIEIWQEYLVFATLFGIADKVLEQLKDIYPDSIPQIEEYTRRVNMTGIYYRSMYRTMYSAEQKVRSSGSGGHASFGGGGGFSGGGVGGGSR